MAPTATQYGSITSYSAGVSVIETNRVIGTVCGVRRAVHNCLPELFGCRCSNILCAPEPCKQGEAFHMSSCFNCAIHTAKQLTDPLLLLVLRVSNKLPA